jgi:hypothetical protein
VPVAALLRHDRIPEDPHWLALHRLVRQRAELHAAGRHHGHLAVLEDHDVARVTEDRRDIRGDEHLALAEPDHYATGAVLARHQPIRRRGRHHADGVGAAHLVQRALHRPLQPPGALQMVLDEVR